MSTGRVGGRARSPAPDAPLRRDVRLLGDVLGRVLVEQGGTGLLDDVERIRALSRRAPRQGLARAALGRRRRAAARTPGRRAPRLRASTSSSRTSPSSTTGCGGAGSTRRRSACPASRWPRHSRSSSGRRHRRRWRGGGRRLSLELVLTAHPTEATRRTVLAAHVRLERAPRRARRPGAAAVQRRDGSRMRSPRR